MSRPSKKECVTLDHPLAGATPNPTNDKFGYYVSLGSSRWPTVDTEGVAEAWCRMRMASTLMDKHGGNEVSIMPHAFRSESAVFIMNLSKVLEDEKIGHSGISMLNFQNLALHFKKMPDAATADGVELPRLLFASCRYDATVELGKEGSGLTVEHGRRCGHESRGGGR
jgi:hypothetical protein